MSSNSENSTWSQSEAESLVLWNDKQNGDKYVRKDGKSWFLLHTTWWLYHGHPKYLFLVASPCVKKRLMELLHRCMKWTFPPKENALIIWITTYIQNFHGFWPTAGLWRPDWNRISTDLDVGFGGGWGNNPPGSSRRLLLITASFTGSDTEIDGAGKIGLAVEENKDPLVFEARDKDSEEALVLSDSANFFLARPEDISEGLSPLLFPRLNRIIDRCCAVELSKISLNFLNFIILS